LKLEDFKIISVLGRGTFGKVFLAEYDGVFHAIKTIRKDVLIDMGQIENTKLEKSIMLDCQHPFLVGMDYVFQDNLRLYFVMDFVKGGELYRHFL
jgi:serum/glucocorticoid-regulated kinase 2